MLSWFVRTMDAGSDTAVTVLAVNVGIGAKVRQISAVKCTEPCMG